MCVRVCVCVYVCVLRTCAVQCRTEMSPIVTTDWVPGLEGILVAYSLPLLLSRVFTHFDIMLPRVPFDLIVLRKAWLHVYNCGAAMPHHLKKWYGICRTCWTLYAAPDNDKELEENVQGSKRPQQFTCRGRKTCKFFNSLLPNDAVRRHEL